MNDSVIPARPGRLAQLGLLRFSGADALEFLQGQVSNDTHRLADGAPLLCAYSSAQGRVIALLTLLPHSSGILAILPADLAAPTAQRLAKFVLRSKVRIEVLSGDFLVAGAQGPAQLAAAGLTVPAAAAYVEYQGVGIAPLPGAASRFWLVGPAASLAWLEPATPERENDWRLADIRAGLPQVYRENSEQFVAQMLNLDLLDGISFTKGCYTGQEIIARTQHLGRIKRRLHRVAIKDGSAAIGATVVLADGRSGRICELARVGAGSEALAVLPLAASGELSGETGGIAAALQELPYSLSAGAKNTSTQSSSSMS